MNFSNITTSTGNVLFTPAQQAAAWDAFINQDPYLSKNRGKYAERGATFLPFFTNVDFSVAQDIIATIGKSRHTFQVRADVLNFGNLLNSNWGGGQAFTSLQPLVTTSSSSSSTCRVPSATTAATYCLRTIGGSPLSNSYTPTANTGDVYRIQIGIRYIFN